MPRKNDREDSEDEYDTDSDADYELEIEEAEAIARTVGVSAKAIRECFKSQRGVCRVTGLPFGQGLYAPTAAARRTTASISDDNVILVVEAMERMRQSVSMPWRSFVHLLQATASEADL